jgi:hypothetical protein
MDQSDNVSGAHRPTLLRWCLCAQLLFSSILFPLAARTKEEPAEVVAAASTSAAATSSSTCPLNALAPSPDGVRRVAFLVGVGTFRSREIPPLAAPRQDVDVIETLLTSPGGFQFPKQNVCILLDEDATRANFVRDFQEAVVKRVGALPKNTATEVLIYFSGHGSYTKDHSGDELDDGMDELYVLNDSWAGGVAPLRDDEFNHMIAAVYQYTHNLTIILDSCNSGTALKGVDDLSIGKDLINKLVPPQLGEVPGDDSGPALDSLVGIVSLSAARDGSSALAPRSRGNSLFTRALLEAMSSLDAAPLRWNQVARRMNVSIDASTHGRQQPEFQGDLDRLVFSAATRARPYGWDVVSIAGSTIKMRGPPLPGIGDGAVLRIYDGSVDRAAAANPAGAKAAAVVTRFQGLEAEARIQGVPGGKITPGDIAVVTVASDASRKLSVALKTSGTNALESGLTSAIKAGIATRVDAHELLDLSAALDAFRVEGDDASKIALRGPEGVIRRDGIAPDADTVIDQLIKFARQRVILSLEGEAAASLHNNDSIRVRLVSRSNDGRERACSARARAQWRDQCPNAEQIIPDCADWTIEVANTSKIPLRVGGAILFNDGGIQGLPRDGSQFILPADGKFRQLDPRLIVHSQPPINIPEYVVVFGTDESLDINWSILTDPVSTEKGLRSAAPHPLQSALRSLVLGTKGGDVSVERNTAPWTSTRLPMRVLANPQFEDRDATTHSCANVSSKEYTVQAFNLDPYLPRKNEALHRVLTSGYKLATLAGPGHTGDGIPYLQHDWSTGSAKALPTDDPENLAKGIDCSRAIWYAFTRSELPYTSGKWHTGYLPTSQMMESEAGSCATNTPKRSLMRDNFDDCLGKPFQTGDVLVFQGKRPGGNACVGHTVMVIDPDMSIGWGSHGWDGSTDDTGKKLNDTGVEYQKILRGGWAKWDRKEFQLKACWRHRAFIDKE